MADINQDGTEVRVNLGEARGRLADLVDLTLTGTRVLLMRRNVPVVQLMAVKDYSHERHSHPDGVSCYEAGDAGHPARYPDTLYQAEGLPDSGPHPMDPPALDTPESWQPPPPPPPEERPQKAPKPPRNREVSGPAKVTESAKTLLPPSAAGEVLDAVSPQARPANLGKITVDPNAAQRRRDAILNNLGGNKKKR